MDKYCSKCDTKKDIILFYKCSGKKDGMSSNCKECDDKSKNLWRSQNQDKVAAYEKRRWKLKGRSSKKRIDDRARSSKSRVEMSDKYILELMTKKSDLVPDDIPNELIEIYRIGLRLKRALGLTPKLNKPNTN